MILPTHLRCLVDVENSDPQAPLRLRKGAILESRWFEPVEGAGSSPEGGAEAPRVAPEGLEWEVERRMAQDPGGNVHGRHYGCEVCDARRERHRVQIRRERAHEACRRAWEAHRDALTEYRTAETTQRCAATTLATVVTALEVAIARTAQAAEIEKAAAKALRLARAEWSAVTGQLGGAWEPGP